LPFLSSSLILSLISTFASIAIPNAKAIAANPGSVRVAWRIDNKATNNNKFTPRAKIETPPKDHVVKDHHDGNSGKSP